MYSFFWFSFSTWLSFAGSSKGKRTLQITSLATSPSVAPVTTWSVYVCCVCVCMCVRVYMCAGVCVHGAYVCVCACVWRSLTCVQYFAAYIYHSAKVMLCPSPSPPPTHRVDSGPLGDLLQDVCLIHPQLIWLEHKGHGLLWHFIEPPALEHLLRDRQSEPCNCSPNSIPGPS